MEAFLTALTLLLAVAAVPAPALGERARPAPAPPAPRELVVLVHGMGRTRFSMRPVARACEEAGYEVLNYGYPSRSDGVEAHGRALADRLALENARPEVTRIHMVGHSLGNIVIRWVLANGRPAKAGRAVMLAPPNRGAHLADIAAPWLSWLSRPLPDLTTDPNSAARSLPPADGVPIGVIAGSWDHTVRLPETRLEGQTDHVVVRSGHTFIMRRRDVHDLTVRFLRTGSFHPRAADRAGR